MNLFLYIPDASPDTVFRIWRTSSVRSRALFRPRVHGDVGQGCNSFSTTCPLTSNRLDVPPVWVTRSIFSVRIASIRGSSFQDKLVKRPTFTGSRRRETGAPPSPSRPSKFTLYRNGLKNQRNVFLPF